MSDAIDFKAIYYGTREFPPEPGGIISFYIDSETLEVISKIGRAGEFGIEVKVTVEMTKPKPYPKPPIISDADNTN